MKQERITSYAHWGSVPASDIFNNLLNIPSLQYSPFSPEQNHVGEFVRDCISKLINSWLCA